MFSQKKSTKISSTLHEWDTVFALEFKNIQFWQEYQNYWQDYQNFGNSSEETIRLRLALETHYANSAKEVYTDIIIHVPQALYTPMRGKIEAHLQELHETAFKGRLYRNRQPSYYVLPQENMDADSITFYFGPYIFIPHPDDKPLFSLKMSIDGQTVPSWFPNQNPTDFLTIYEGQEGFRFGTDLSCPLRIEKNLWGQRPQSFYNITTNQIDKGNIVVTTADVAADCITVTPEQEMHINCKSMGQTPHPTPINFVLTPFEKQQNVQHQSHKKTCDFAPGKDLSNIAGKIFIDGFLLPKLHMPKSPFEDLNSWHIWLDSRCKLLEPSSDRDENIFYTFKHNKNSNEIFFKKGAQKWKPITSLASHLQALLFKKNLPIELQEHFFGALRNKSSIECPLFSQTPVIIGRTCKGFPAETHIFRLNQLENTTKLERAGNKTVTDLGHIGTSRTHLKATLSDDGMLRIEQLSTRSPIYILDSNNRISDVLHPQSSTGKKVTHIPKGTSFIVGSYLLRFDNAS